MQLSLYEIGQVVGAKNNLAVYPNKTVSGLEFDSRKIGPGDVFVPLRGARDGHDFIDMALEKGALASLSEKEIEGPHLLVDDVLTAFQNLAAYYIDKMRVEVIAVTGSNGKTTTKDMIHDVLATTYQTYKTQGNYNNEIGLPYTVLHMPDDTQKLVLEMGQDHLGDIALLSQIARPQIGVVTLIGEAHLEFFGSREKIAEGKLQIAEGMVEGSLLILPQDAIITPYLPKDLELVRFGEEGDLYLTSLEEEKKSLRFETNALKTAIQLPLPGKYNATNAMLAAYVGKRCGVSEDKIASALAEIQLTKNRTEWKRALNGAEILSDVYNANPTAMRLILETFAAIPKNPSGRKVVVLADMKELGSDSAQLHAGMVDSLSDQFDCIYLYGPDMAALAEVMKSDSRLRYFASSQEFESLTSSLVNDLQPADQLLLKGSNSMKLGHIVDVLTGQGGLDA